MRRWLAGVLLLAAASAGAQSTGGAYRIEPQRVAGGGGVSAAGAYSLRGTIAQSEAGGVLAGGDYEVTGGLHRRALASGPPPGPHIYADGFE